MFYISQRIVNNLTIFYREKSMYILKRIRPWTRRCCRFTDMYFNRVYVVVVVAAVPDSTCTRGKEKYIKKGV